MELRHDRMEYGRIVAVISLMNNEWNEYIKKILKQNSYKGVVSSHGPVLTTICEHNNKITVTELAERVIRPSPTITEILNRLEKMKYIERNYSESDKRKVNVSCTESGKALQKIFASEVMIFLNNLLAHYSDEEKKMLTSLLGNVNLPLSK